MWRVDFYETHDGKRPVEAFLLTLPTPLRAKVLARIALLQEQGPNLPFPYSSQVEGKLRELRVQHGKARVRVLYFLDPQRVCILLHAFLKRTEKLPEHDIQVARDRMAEYISRKR